MAHFPRDITRLRWRVLACHACAIVCMYIDLDIVCFACVRAVLARVVGSVCCRSAVGLFPLVLCCVMCALLSAIIWCTRVTMRCNRFPVLDSVVLPCALLCDCGTFYKCLLCVWLMVGWFARSCCAVPLVWLVLVCAVVC